MNFGENVYFRNGICQNLGSEAVDVLVDLLICNTRNEASLIIKNEAGTVATCNSRLLKLSKVQRSVLLRDSSETIHKVYVTI